MKRFFIALCLILLAPASLANAPLTADQAFSPTIEQQGANELLLHWRIAPGYHLYKRHFSFSVDKPKETQLESITWPTVSGHLSSPNGDHLAVYTGDLKLTIPYTSTQGHIVFTMRYQGCASAGFCYPPTTKHFAIPREGPYYTTITPMHKRIVHAVKKHPEGSPNQVEQLLNHSHLLILLGGFFVFGLLVSLTPCVLPMIPVLVSILVSAKGKRLLSKAIAYVLGMAVSYAAVGAVVSLLGSSIQADLQQPWVIIVMTLLFVIMALALFDCFQLSLPGKITNRLNDCHINPRYGVISVFLTGIISSLVLSPCVTPPLLGALVYIAHSGYVLRGTLALFAMGLGMGVPLLIVGLFSERLLPKAGNWMNHIKGILGMLMLAVAVITINRILPNLYAQMIWIAWFIGLGFFLLNEKLWRRILASLCFTYAGWLAAQTLYLGANSTLPFPRHTHHHKVITHTKQIHSLAELHHALSTAPHDRLVMLRLTADWCLACELMDAHVFSDPSVQQALKKVTQLTLDISHSSDKKQALMKQFQLIAPPVILFFKDGKELPNSRLVGEQSVEGFLKRLKSLN